LFIVQHHVLRPAIAEKLQELESTPQLDYSILSPSEFRMRLKSVVDEMKPQAEQVGNIEDRGVETSEGKVPVRIFSPDRNKADLPIMVYFHGGGWVAGDIDTHDNICRVLVNRCNVILVSVGYGLAPELQFPTQIYQCLDVLHWVYNNSNVVGGDNHKLIVMGDSAGANIAASLCILVRDRGDSIIQRQILICPATDLSKLNKRSYEECDNFSLSKAQMQWFITHYLGELQSANVPLASPLLAKNHNELPPAIIVTAEHDVLRDEGKLYAEKLKDHGVAIEYYCMSHMIHAGVYWAVAHDVVKQDIEYICSLINRELLELEEKAPLDS